MKVHTIKTTLAMAVAAAAFTTPALAQKPDAAGGAVVASAPGKAAAARTIELSAQVVAIDKATRTVTLKNSKGETRDVVAGDDVKNFDQVKVGDMVVARFVQAISFELKKTKGAKGDIAVTEGVAAAKPGEKPAAGGARQISALLTVVALDPKNKTITFRGPRGNVVTLDVENPDQFKVVKQGDQVEATYTEAVALSVEPAPAKAAPKK